MEVMRRIVVARNAALRFAESFEEASLDAPSLVCERVVMGVHLAVIEKLQSRHPVKSADVDEHRVTVSLPSQGISLQR
jgi:hypothetical protein